MEQIFNPKRFLKYLLFNISANRNSYLFMLAGSFIALFLFLVFVLSTEGIRDEPGWLATFFGTSIVATLLLIGHAFPGIRRKKTAITFLMAPASTFEKYFSEVVLKMVLFALLYPVFFRIAGQMALGFLEYVSLYKSYPPFTYNALKSMKQQEFFPIIIWLYLFGASIAFAGASAFKKFPLVKTLISITVFGGLVAGYFYILLEKMHVEHGIEYYMFEILNLKDGNEPPVALFCTILGISSVVALAYAYFNIKEREV